MTSAERSQRVDAAMRHGYRVMKHFRRLGSRVVAQHYVARLRRGAPPFRMSEDYLTKHAATDVMVNLTIANPRLMIRSHTQGAA